MHQYKLGNIVNVIIRPSGRTPHLPLNRPHWIKSISFERIQIQNADIFDPTLEPSVTSSLPSRDIIGLKLTEGWLIEFGFKFKEEGPDAFNQIWEKEGFRIWEHDKGFCFELEDEAPIEYVHQLQNLYFAIKGNRIDKKTNTA